MRNLEVMRRTFLLGAVAAALLLSGCATTRTAAPAPSSETLWTEYQRGIEEAKYPTPERISRDLVAITTFSSDLQWDETRQKVLMVAWTEAKWFTPGQTTLARAVWVTAAPFLQHFCAATGLTGAALDLRLTQRLGIPPNKPHGAFVEMWVDPADLFRPCPDPETNDRECQVNLTAGPVDRTSSCPWSQALQQQVSGSYVTVSREHLDWMCAQWTSSYPPGKPRESYPWTALGYTYDWAPSSAKHVGESEFLARKGSPVVVRRVVPTAEYCAQPAGQQPSGAVH